MSSINSKFEYAEREIGSWTVPTVEFASTDQDPIRIPISGYIVNSVTERKDRLQSWKVAVSSKVKSKRGGKAWNPQTQYAIAISFSFNISAGKHGYTPLDVENFTKPILDAIAAGLFCNEETDVNNIQHWCYDDSNFNTLFFHRLPDAVSSTDEGIAICISSSGSGV